MVFFIFLNNDVFIFLNNDHTFLYGGGTQKHIQAFAFLRIPPSLLLQTQIISPTPNHYSTFAYPHMIHNYPKTSGASSCNFIKQVFSIHPTIPKYFSIDSSLVSLLILFWKGDYSSCPMGIIYDNHIIFTLEDCNRLIGLSTL